MKVGTDGVLLGAWADVSKARAILDIGAGTGLIAIMLAQQSKMAMVTGVEIEALAAKEAAANALNTPWNDRIKIVHQAFQDFSCECNQKFDVIVSNPPFFSNSIKSPKNEKSIARHNHALPFDALLHGAVKLLEENGKLSVILPVNEGERFIALAENYKLYLTRLVEVSPSPRRGPNRLLIEFSKQKSELLLERLDIFDLAGSYSPEYKKLTAEFYLNF